MITQNEIVAIHERAKGTVRKMYRDEAELILSLQDVIKYKVYRKYKYPNLFSYLTLSLGLSENRAQDFSVVVRASLKFEKFNQAVCNGKLTVSKARRITSVLTLENQNEWLEKAKLSSHRQLERLVAAKNPESAMHESYKFISANQVEVKLTMTLEEFNQFKRAQDLLCQKMKKQVSLKSTLVQTTRQYLKRNDPVEKAAIAVAKQFLNRARNERKTGTCTKRLPIAASVRHSVNLRDRSHCQAEMPDGKPCGDSKWVDLHHIKPVYLGGENKIENLITLCRGHHQMQHENLRAPF